jgi:hypothetical protein
MVGLFGKGFSILAPLDCHDTIMTQRNLFAKYVSRENEPDGVL